MLKWVLRIFSAIAGLFIILILIVVINNKIQINKESKLYPAPGVMVDVNGHKMHVYTEGTGDDTLVFMAGGQNSSPTIDFKPMWSQLSDDFKIAVVEKRGYGWSEAVKYSRKIDNMLEETRSTLKGAGLKAPFILLPQSMSGLEAIYWAQKYPEEVKGIIGLDAAVPEIYKQFVLDKKELREKRFTFTLFRSGILRLFPTVFDSLKVMQTDKLTEEDKKTYLAMIYKSLGSVNMYDEIAVVKENAVLVGSTPAPVNTPIHYFISDGRDLQFLENWKETLSAYAGKVNEGTYSYLDCGHEINNSETDLIVRETRYFIKEVINK